MSIFAAAKPRLMLVVVEDRGISVVVLVWHEFRRAALVRLLDHNPRQRWTRHFFFCQFQQEKVSADFAHYCFGLWVYYCY